MIRRTPPQLATRLLQRFGPRDPAFAGDLLEEFQSGKSSGWYWRQAISVLWASLFREVRVHPVACVLCLVTGWFVSSKVASIVFRFTVDVAFRSYTTWYFAQGGLPPPTSGAFIWVLNFAMTVCAFAFGGFAAVRCYSGRRSLMALMFAVIVGCEQISLVIWLSTALDLTTSPAHYVFQPTLPQNATLWALPPIAALIGGIFGARREATGAA